MIQRRTAVGLAFAACLSLLAACGFESPAVENTEQASVQATDFTVGALRVDDTSITAGTTDTSAPTFYLVVTIVNVGKTSDTLTGVTSSQGTVTLAGTGTTGGQLTLPPGVPVEINVASTTSPGPTLTVTASPTPQPGAFVPVVFTFANAGASATVQVPVVPAGETTAATQPVPTATASVPTEVGDSADD